MKLQLKRSFALIKNYFYIKFTNLTIRLYKWSIKKTEKSIKEAKELI